MAARPFDHLNHTELPFDLVGNVIVIHAQSGEEGLDLILDTGASHSVITPQSVERLALETTSAHPLFPDAAEPGVGSEAIQFARIPHLEIGTLVLDDVDVAVMDMEPLNARIQRLFNRRVDGALGFNVLASYRVTIDFPAQRIEIGPSERGRGE